MWVYYVCYVAVPVSIIFASCHTHTNYTCYCCSSSSSGCCFISVFKPKFNFKTFVFIKTKQFMCHKTPFFFVKFFSLTLFVVFYCDEEVSGGGSEQNTKGSCFYHLFSMHFNTRFAWSALVVHSHGCMSVCICVCVSALQFDVIQFINFFFASLRWFVAFVVSVCVVVVVAMYSHMEHTHNSRFNCWPMSSVSFYAFDRLSVACARSESYNIWCVRVCVCMHVCMYVYVPPFFFLFPVCSRHFSAAMLLPFMNYCLIIIIWLIFVYIYCFVLI